MRLIYSYIPGGEHPVIGQVLHRHAAAMGPADDVFRYNRYVCGVLGAIAQAIDDCDRLLDFLDAVESGREATVETGGNDVTLTMTAAGVQVDIEVNDDWVGSPEGHFSLQDWRLALEGWKRFLAMPQEADSVVEVDL